MLGERLANYVLRYSYGKEYYPIAPELSEVIADGKEITLTFKNIVSRLMTFHADGNDIPIGIEDENGKMNLSLLDIGGGALVVSQFTLCADCTHGRRPSFTRSAPPAQANELYEYFTRALGEQGVSHIETGVFGADMAVTLLNDGPVTIILDTKDLK